MWRCVAIVTLLAVAGCVSERYGRLADVSARERRLLNCKQIEFEIEKARFFVADVRLQRSGAEPDGALAFLDTIEGDAAEDSGERRLQQLRELQAERGCTA